MQAISQPTSTTPAVAVTGKLCEQHEGRIVLALPGTDYQLYLQVDQPLPDHLNGKTITGIIHARARRVDVVGSGGSLLMSALAPPSAVTAKSSLKLVGILMFR